MHSPKATLPQWRQQDELSERRRTRPRGWAFAVAILTCFFILWQRTSGPPEIRPIKPPSSGKVLAGLPLEITSPHLQSFQDCSIDTILSADLAFLSTARPLELGEFESRRDRLAKALNEQGLDAFIAEPGYTFKYYANISQPEWEIWEPEERPFLMIVQPVRELASSDEDGGQATIRANTTFLVPSFEAERARLLSMPFSQDTSLVTYEEHWNPYKTLLESHVFANKRPRDSTPSQDVHIMVDDEMRDFIARGLSSSGFQVSGLDGAVEQVKQRKSEAEIEILRAVNTGTVEAVRAVRRCLHAGLTEEDVAAVLDNTLRAIGLDPFFDIVLFDANAANPHGGTNGTLALNAETMVLIDVGAHLYGYSSDICRSFFPPILAAPASASELAQLSAAVRKKIHVWDVVFKAQTESLHALQAGGTCAAVDLAARHVIAAAGYGEAFTHRVGHGIGIKAHESPYLHQGNTQTLLHPGMTFTSEPGVYLVDRFGVRHEDVLLIMDHGPPEVLSGRRAVGPWEP